MAPEYGMLCCSLLMSLSLLTLSDLMPPLAATVVQPCLPRVLFYIGPDFERMLHSHAAASGGCSSLGALNWHCCVLSHAEACLWPFCNLQNLRIDNCLRCQSKHCRQQILDVLYPAFALTQL